MIKLFQDHARLSRRISIEVEVDFITFKFPNEDNREFYWIGTEDWLNDTQHWQKHMMEKAWFGQDMLDYINQTVKNLYNRN